MIGVDIFAGHLPRAHSMRIAVLACLFVAMSSTFVSADLVAFQGFDSTLADTWAFTPDPARFSVGADVWTEATTVGSGSNAISAFAGTHFWAMHDLENGNGGRSGDLQLEFAQIDVSAFENVVISFRYNAFEWDSGSGDDMSYGLGLNGASPSLTPFFDPSGSDVSTSGWTEFTINVPNGTTTVDFVLAADQNGGDDWGGFDSVQINGDMAAIPEASSFACLGLVGLVVGGLQQRKRILTWFAK